PDLDLHVRLLAQVEVPARRLVGAAVRRNDEVVATVARIHERVRPLGARAAADRAQEQRRHADHLVPDPPAAALVDRLVDTKHLRCDAHLAVLSTWRPFHITTGAMR